MESKFSEEDKPFYKYCLANGLGDFYIDNKTNKMTFQLSEIDINNLGKKKSVFSGIEGGLVKGIEENNKGGIFILSPWKDNMFRYSGRVLPGFYISGYKAYPTYKNEFLDLEKSVDNFINWNRSKFSIPEKCKVIDTKENAFSVIVLAPYSQFIFSKSTVRNHLERIVEIDASCS